MAHPTTLLVRLPNPLGDVVMATPLLEVIHKKLPETNIVLAGAPAHQELLEGLPFFHQYLPFDQDVKRSIRKQSSLIKSLQADSALILPNSWSSALAVWRAGIPQRIGRRGQGRGLILTHSLPPIPEPRPMTDLYLEMAPLLLGEALLSKESLNANPTPSLCFEKNASPPHTKPLIAISPGAAFGNSKQYPAHLIAESLAIVQKQFDFHAIVLGPSSEFTLLQEVHEELQTRNVSAEIQKPSLRVSKSILASAKVLLTMDSGARHMAAALGTPQVVLYGPTHPAWSAHSLHSTSILRQDELDCLSCHHKTCPKDDHPCMNLIEPKRVAQALLSRLSSNQTT